MKPMMKRILAIWVALLLALVPFALTEAGGTTDEAPARVEQQELKSEPAPVKQEEPKGEPASEGETGMDAVPDGKQNQQDDAASGEAQAGGSVPAGDDAQGGGEAPFDAPAQAPAQPADDGDAKAADPSAPADGDEVQSGEDEATEQPAEPVEATEEESDLEEAVEEEPALLAAPALKARALLAAGAGAYTGICRYCGQPVEAEYKDEGNHIVTCYYGGCKHYNHELYTGHWGGTATCTEQAICGSCGHTYGDTDPNNHDFSRKSGNPSVSLAIRRAFGHADSSPCTGEPRCLAFSRMNDLPAGLPSSVSPAGCHLPPGEGFSQASRVRIQILFPKASPGRALGMAVVRKKALAVRYRHLR